MSDIVNGLFEFLAFFAVMASCIRVIQDKKVAGISLWTTTFFTSWGVWNLFYYPSLGQTYSGMAAGAVCLANFSWCILLVIYRGKNENGKV